jgi:hypothetical protein
MMNNHAVVCGPGYGEIPNLQTHPDNLASDSRLSRLEKRAILADWASDARAVEDSPELRQLDNGALVRVGDVLNALRLLDNAANLMPAATRPAFARRRKLQTTARTFRKEPDDDGPPPCAAGASPPSRLINTVAKAVPLPA